MKLSDEQRSSILGGHRPRFPIERREDCPEGEVMIHLYGRSGSVVLRWTGPVKDHGELYAGYVVIDTRPERLLQRVAGYTATPARAIAEAGEAVPAEYQEELSTHAQGGITLSQMQQRDRDEKLRLEARLNNKRVKHRRASVVAIKRRISRLDDRAA